MPELIGALGLIGAAAVTGLFTVIAQKMRRENEQAHGEVIDVLGDIAETLEDIEEDLEDITEWQDGHTAQHEKDNQ